MTVQVVSALARPDLADQADEATANAFPEYNTHGDVASPRWSRLYEEYPAYQLVLWDDATGEVLGEANTIPCRFDGTVQGLPRGIDEVLASGLPEVGVALEPTALCALAIAIPSTQENRGQWSSPQRQDTSVERRMSAWKTDSQGTGASSPPSSNAMRWGWCAPVAGRSP